jgi:hypothetical protein
MKQKTVGIYQAGPDLIQLVAREGTGGEFYLYPGKDKIARIKIGMDYDYWWEAVKTCIHEIGEFARFKSGCRFIYDNDYSNNLGAFLFSYDHTQYSNLCAIEGMFLANALPDLNKVWKQWKKDKSKRR